MTLTKKIVVIIGEIDTYDQDGFDEDEAQEIKHAQNNEMARGQGDALDLGDQYEDGDEDEEEEEEGEQEDG